MKMFIINTTSRMQPDLVKDSISTWLENASSRRFIVTTIILGPKTLFLSNQHAYP